MTTPMNNEITRQLMGTEEIRQDEVSTLTPEMVEDAVTNLAEASCQTVQLLHWVAEEIALQSLRNGKHPSFVTHPDSLEKAPSFSEK